MTFIKYVIPNQHRVFIRKINTYEFEKQNILTCNANIEYCIKTTIIIFFVLLLIHLNFNKILILLVNLYDGNAAYLMRRVQ